MVLPVTFISVEYLVLRSCFSWNQRIRDEKEKVYRHMIYNSIGLNEEKYLVHTIKYNI